MDYLAAPGSGIGLTVKIPEGMRATSVKSDEIVGVAGFLFPGSHVDVLVTFRSDRFPTPATQIVLQDVEVLTVGQKLEPDPQGKPENVSVVTLLLTPEDSQKLVLASTPGNHSVCAAQWRRPYASQSHAGADCAVVGRRTGACPASNARARACR